MAKQKRGSSPSAPETINIESLDALNEGVGTIVSGTIQLGESNMVSFSNAEQTTATQNTEVITPTEGSGNVGEVVAEKPEKTVETKTIYMEGGVELRNVPVNVQKILTKEEKEILAGERIPAPPPQVLVVDKKLFVKFVVAVIQGQAQHLSAHAGVKRVAEMLGEKESWAKQQELWLGLREYFYQNQGD